MTDKELRHALLESFPNAYLIIRDTAYRVPALEEVKRLLKETFIEEYQYRANSFDCDDYALILDAFVKQEGYKQGWSLPWTFGQVYGVFPDYSPEFHARNIILTTDGLYLIEPQLDEVRGINVQDVINICWM